ncbi:MAG TPA: sugar phosphate isomerase/epimerase [Pyrinomonadaceae bacterium]|nr:sugar phosphate isomerase/epimerase [Pyrinomonadaceae bacterium]
MKIALNGATTMHADLQTDIAAAREAGFDCIEIWAAKLREFLKTNTVDDLKKLIQNSGLKPWSINSIEHVTFRNETDYAAIRRECEELSAIAGEIKCPYVVVVPGKLPQNAAKEQITDESVRVLNELADIAEKHNVGLAFEFLGQTDCSVQTLELCNEIVEKTDRPNVGLVLDTFHFYAGNSDIETIGKLDPKKLFIFHINDSEDLPKADLTDAHRLLPGLGILPLSSIKAQLDNIGFEGTVSIEIFRPEYWERDPFELASEARTATASVLGLI